MGKKKTNANPRGDGVAVATYQNKIYVIGGRIIGGSTTGINEVYDAATDTWATKTPMPTPRQELEANIVNGKIYLMGGAVPLSPDPNNSYFDETNINEVYDPTTDSWITQTPIPNNVVAYASAVVSNKIYIVSKSRTQIYNPETGSWGIGAPIPHPVDYAGTVATAGVLAPQRIYVIGGRENGVEVAYNQMYNPKNDSWSMGESMKTPRYMLGVASANDLIYAVGGASGTFGTAVTTDLNEQYTPFGYETSTQQTELFPITWIAATIAVVVAIAITSVYLIHKRKK